MKHKVDESNLVSNNWFAGFIDADGGFQIRYTQNLKLRIACTLRIEQRMIEPYSGLSYEPLFLKIALFLNTKLEVIKHKDKKYYLVRASNRRSLNILISYFHNFKLYSSKYLDYENWFTVVEFL